MLNHTDTLLGVLMLVEALRPHASFPPPAESAPMTWIKAGEQSKPAELPHNSSERCCIDDKQQARALHTMRNVWPSLPSRSDSKPLFGGSRPMPPSGGEDKEKSDEPEPFKNGMVRQKLDVGVSSSLFLGSAGVGGSDGIIVTAAAAAAAVVGAWTGGGGKQQRTPFCT